MATTPDADDGDLFHAVMAFLEDNEAAVVHDETTSDSYGSSQSDAGSSPTHKSSSSSTAREKPPLATGVLPLLQPRRPKINRSRQRMREETVAMREQVLELQERLETLKGGVSSRVGIRPDLAKKAELQSREARRLRALAWQALAERESVKKTKAEEEREQLRALLKEQKLAFRRLRRYLAKYSAQAQWAALKSELKIPGDLDEDEQDEKEKKSTEVTQPVDEFRDIAHALPAMYWQTSAVFSDERLDAMTSSLRDLKIQNELTPTMSIEALDSRVLPFSVEATADAVWQFHLTKVRKLSNTVDKRLEESDNCIRRVFSSAIEHKEISGTSRVRMETRRFVEQERVVMLQSAIYDNLMVENTIVQGYGLRQFQWTVVGPPRNFSLRRSGKPMAQIEVFEVTVPILDHVSGIDRPVVLSRMKKLCQVTAMVHMEMERESVECILMDSLLKNSTLNPSMVEPSPFLRAPQIAEHPCLNPF